MPELGTVVVESGGGGAAVVDGVAASDVVDVVPSGVGTPPGAVVGPAAAVDEVEATVVGVAAMDDDVLGPSSSPSPLPHCDSSTMRRISRASPMGIHHQGNRPPPSPSAGGVGGAPGGDS